MPLEQIQLWIMHYGYGAIVVLLALGIVGLPIPDETLLTLTGVLVFRGVLHLVPSVLSSFAGTVIGISVSFAIGRVGGARVLRKFGRWLHVTPERLATVEHWFHRRGKWALTAGYFVPGVRHVIAIVAGSSGLSFRHFATFAFPGAAVWTGVFIAAGYSLGDGWERFPGTVRTISIIVFAVLVLAGGIVLLVRKRRRA